MKLIYVIGPYRSPTEHGVSENIRRAEAVAAEVWKMGAACICPHKNTAFMGGVVDDKVFLQGDLKIMARCDAVVTVDGWEASEGSCGEVDAAVEWGITVFHGIESLKKWLGALGDKE
ncbi:MAG TPA: DUF4406 domain-containing protein [Prosthecobacter sp.]|nr:DUF4406 domain-containing protein [Prosthecobacter sp.]